MPLIQSIIQTHEEFARIRRELHAIPESCYEEVKTASYIMKKLEELGIPFHSGIAKTGIVGVIKKGNSNKSIGLRADLDGLKMTEVNEFPHASKHEGRMHACGHDGHMAMLLSAAKYLATEGRFDGTVYLVFQPAEEGGAGAKRMLEEGLAERFPMTEGIYGMHNWPGAPVGSLGTTTGPMMASHTSFHIKIKARGGHAAMPHQCVDPVIVAVQIAQACQSIVSRSVSPLESVVVSITQLNSGTAVNIIPDVATLDGTIRTFSYSALELVETRMRDICVHTGAAFGCEKVTTDFNRAYPPLINQPRETAFALDVMKKTVPAELVNPPGVERTMGSEDFAFFLEKMPGCFAFIGNGDGSHRDEGHGPGPCVIHQTSYDFNDAIIPIGASYYSNLVETALAPHA